jgi:hypothetical protein
LLTVPCSTRRLGGPRRTANSASLYIITNNREYHTLQVGLQQVVAAYGSTPDYGWKPRTLDPEYLRLSDSQQRPEKVPYALTFLERGLSTGQIVLNAIEQIVPGITRSNLTEEDRRKMTQAASFCGKPLCKQGFWKVLMRTISCEAYLLGVDAGGYNSTLTNWNAADAIPWFLGDFGVDAKYQGFRDGFQKVPLKLAALFAAAGGDVRLSGSNPSDAGALQEHRSAALAGACPLSSSARGSAVGRPARGERGRHSTVPC